MEDRIEVAGTSVQLHGSNMELNPKPQSNRNSVGVRFEELPAHPRTASRGRSRTRRSTSRHGLKGSLEPSNHSVDKGKSHVHVAGTNDLGPDPRIPPSSVSASRRPPAVRSNVKQPLPQKSWAAVAKSATKGYNLSYVPPVAVGNKMRVTISPDILQASHPKWDECLVGYLIGKKLPFKLVEAAMKHIWGTHLVDTMANDEGFFFFHVPDLEFRKEILDSGPLTIAKVPLVLQQWHPLINLEKKKHEAVPIWIRLRNIPFSLWSVIGISTIASAVGKPLYVDSQTEKMRMLSYARVCVEIHAGVGLPDVIEVDMLEDIRTVKVEYEWCPSYCPICISFGHKCPTATSDNQPPNSPVMNSRADSPVQARYRENTELAGETWIEVPSRNKSSFQQHGAPNFSVSRKQNKELSPALVHRKPSSSPEHSHARFAVLDRASDEEPEDNIALHPSDSEEPLIVLSTIPSEAELPVLEPHCPAAPTRPERSSVQVLGLPASSNADLLKTSDQAHKLNSNICSSVSEEEDVSHDDAVDSQCPIVMCSISTDRTAPPLPCGTRRSKAKSGTSSNPPLPQHSLKSSKSRKNVK